MRPATWTDEDIAFLQREWAHGVSATQIAARLDGKFSRSAVIGKIHRLRIANAITEPVFRKKFTPGGAYRRRNEGRAAPAMRVRQPTPPRQQPSLASTVAMKPLPMLPVPIPDPAKPTILEIRDHHCRYPYGQSPEMYFCGAKCEQEGSSYCDAHRAIVYQAAEPVKKPLPVKRWAA